MHIIFQSRDINGQILDVWTKLYIVDFTNVYCAYRFVCLLDELHINACITYQVIQIAMKGSGPVFRKNSYNCLFFHCIRCCLPLSNDSLQLEKQGGRSGCRCDTAGYKIHKQIKHVEYFLHSWLHLLFDPIQCVSSSTWIHRTFCQISSNATLKQTIPWDLHRIKSLFVWLLLLSSIMSTCSSPSLWCRRGTAEHLCDWGWMYGQRYAATVLNLMMAKGYSHTVSKLKKKKGLYTYMGLRAVKYLFITFTDSAETHGTPRGYD